MMTASDARRRGLGILFLAGAVGMLIAGLTWLGGVLQGWTFLLYWFGCFGLTFASIFIALIDIWAIRQHTRDEQRDLIQKALEEVDEAQDRKSRES